MLLLLVVQGVVSLVAWGVVLVLRPYIQEERTWYTLLAHASGLHGNTLR